MFDECPFKDGYDLKIGSSSNKVFDPQAIDFGKHDGFKHALVFFGGIEGIEGILENDESTGI